VVAEVIMRPGRDGAFCSAPRTPRPGIFTAAPCSNTKCRSIATWFGIDQQRPPTSCAWRATVSMRGSEGAGKKRTALVTGATTAAPCGAKNLGKAGLERAE